MDQFKILLEDLPAYFRRASEEQQRVLLDFLADWTYFLRRKHRRKDCSIPVDFAIGDKAFSSIIRNVSAGGVFVEKANGIGVGEQTTLAFWFPALAKPSKIKGQVARESSEGFGVQFVTSSYMENQLEKAADRFWEANRDIRK
jgi:hypothetical protein